LSNAPDAHTRLVCVHGAGSGPWVFAGWALDFPQWEVVAPDLQEGLHLATASMADYAAAVRIASERGGRSPLTVLRGWSMGGLVALMAANDVRPAAVVVLEPSLPEELKQNRSDALPVPGTFDPAEVYGSWPGNPPTRRESSFALLERERGVSVPTVPCPLLVIASERYRTTRGRKVAAFYGGDYIEFGDLHHSALLQDPRVRHAILRWISGPVPGEVATAWPAEGDEEHYRWTNPP
jgi:pimeloyl-ACP methyl ester carboxylesterase